MMNYCKLRKLCYNSNFVKSKFCRKYSKFSRCETRWMNIYECRFCVKPLNRYFKGRNFRGFAVFSQIRKSFFPQNFSKDVIRESFFPRNFLKKSSSANILKKNTLYFMISNYCGIRKSSKIRTQERKNSGKQVF